MSGDESIQKCCMNEFLKMIKHRLRVSKTLAVRLLFPRVCPLCGSILGARGTGSSYCRDNPFICSVCYASLVFPKEPRCLKCSRPLFDETKAYCPDCQSRKRYYDQGAALLIHDDAARKILYDLKYHNKRDHADMLAWEAAKVYHQVLKDWNPDVIIPVPLHKKRKLQRGYNQAHLLAVKLKENLEAYQLRIPVDPDYLVRIRKTSAQKELSRDQRWKNVRNAFAVSDREPGNKYAQKTVLLIDDIFTSGATLSECARILRMAGARRVYFLTFSIG